MIRESTILLNVVMLLVLIGTLMAYSTPDLPQDPNAIADASAFEFPWRHLMFVGLGTVALVIGATLKYTHYQNRFLLFTIVIAALVFLVAVLVQGINIRGGVRWLTIGPISFQPSEVAKYALIIWLSVKLAENRSEVKRLFTGFLPHYLIMGIFCGLIVCQPDLGTTVVIGATALTMILVAGARFWHVLLGLAPGIVGVVGLIIATPWRLDRVRVFRDPWLDPLGAGYQLIQSLDAFKRGGLFGQGLGASEQKLYYLPDAHSDFILAVWAEETGLIGTLALLVFFFAFMVAAYRIALNASDRLGSMLATGIATLISFQALLNIGVTTSLLPTKGLPLPFISEGGTALVINMALAGILINVGLHANAPESYRNVHARARLTR